jgi:hypothetical protein
MVDAALRRGLRGLPGGTTLKGLMVERREVKSRLTVPQILAWADAYYTAHGSWPRSTSGVVEEASEESWSAIHQALRSGLRGLPGGSSLRALLIAHRGPATRSQKPWLTEEQVVAWADAYHATHGRWPTRLSGPVTKAPVPGENWESIDWALRRAGRGLTPSSSLARLLARHRGARNLQSLPRLSLARVLAWADVYHAANGRWPTSASGPVAEVPGETWRFINAALYHGRRGLPGKRTLSQLLAGRTPPRRQPKD